MGLLLVISFVVLAVEISLVFEKKIEEILPIMFCSIILVLQVLAMFGRLSFIIVISASACFIFGIVVIYQLKKNRVNTSLFPALIVKCKNHVFTFGFLVFIQVLLVVIIVSQGRRVETYDEFNFWATAVKSLWHYDGFASAKEMWEIWEYPQAMPLFQWLGIYVCGKFDESVLYIMRSLFDIIFWIALLSHLKVKWYWSPLFSLFVILIPSVVNATCYVTLSVDGELAILFGYTLYSILNRKTVNIFYYIRIMVVLSVIALTKSLSIIWISYAIVFLIGVEMYYAKMLGVKIFSKENWRRYLLIFMTFVFPMFILKSWDFFLKLTGSKATHVSARAEGMLQLLLNGEWKWSGYEEKLIRAFFVSFFTEPVSYVYGALNTKITPFIFCVFVGICVFLFVKIGKFDKKLGKLIILYLVCVVVSYSIIFLLTLCTVFVGEIQKYSQIDYMALALGRYCAPVYLGSLFLVIYMLFVSIEKNCEQTVFCRTSLFIMMVATIIGANYSAVNCSNWLSKNKQQQATLRYDEAMQNTRKIFAWTDSMDKEIGNTKTLYISTKTIDRRDVYNLFPIIIRNPVGLYAQGTLENVQNYLRQWDYQYIYYADEPYVTAIVEWIDTMVLEDKKMNIGGLYKICEAGNGMVLKRMN